VTRDAQIDINKAIYKRFTAVRAVLPTRRKGKLVTDKGTAFFMLYQSLQFTNIFTYTNNPATNGPYFLLKSESIFSFNGYIWYEHFGT
jgi:hypothetical protein